MSHLPFSRAPRTHRMNRPRSVWKNSRTSKTPAATSRVSRSTTPSRGTVTAALAETVQRERTLIFFFSDNGGHTPSGSNRRGAIKGTLYGRRRASAVPARSAGESCRQSIREHPVSSVDVSPLRLLLLPASRCPRDKKYDSVNIVPHLAGEAAKNSAPMSAAGACTARIPSPSARQRKLVRTAALAPQLYDLATDIAESKNLAMAQPEVTARLTAALEAWEQGTR